MIPDEPNKATQNTPDTLKDNVDENVAKAFEQAEADIETDPELNDEPAPEDDLDEGELARLDNDNDNTDLV